MTLLIKRVYDNPLPSDGKRVLVDRLWPRGMSKSRAKIDLWLQDIAPSNMLRKWFNHEPENWVEFKKRYFIELSAREEILKKLVQMMKDGNVTLVFAARNENLNNAVVIKDYLCSIYFSKIKSHENPTDK